METYQILENALAVIGTEKQWCTGVGGWHGPVKFCAEGAILYAINGSPIPDDKHFEDGLKKLMVHPAYLAVAELLYHPDESPQEKFNVVWNYNDDHTYEEVKDLFKMAIRSEKEKVGIVVEIEEPVLA